MKLHSGGNSVRLLGLDSPCELLGNVSRTLPLVLLSCWLFLHLEIGRILKPVSLRHAKTSFLSVFRNLYYVFLSKSLSRGLGQSKT